MSEATNKGKTQVVIVGGGIMGVCSAYYLLHSQPQAEVEVTLIEESYIAAGASGKAGGFLASDWISPPTADLGTLSYKLHQELALEHGGAEKWGYRGINTYGVTLDPTQTSPSSVSRAWEPEKNVVFSSVRATPSPIVQEQIESWLDTQAIQSVSILGTDQTTAQVDPLLFTRELFRLSREKGLKYLKGEPVRVEMDYQTRELENPTRTIRANKLVIAAGPWTSHVLQKLGIFPPTTTLTLPIIPLPGHSLILRPLSSTPLPASAIYASVKGAQAGEYPPCPETFNRPDGTVYLAGANGGVPVPASVSDSHLLHDRKRFDELLRSAKLISSHLDVDAGRCEVIKEQLCFRPLTPDGHSILGEIVKDVLVCTGAGPWGITLGPGMGKVVAEMILGKERSADIEGLGVERWLNKPR
ncbi:FAD dependent oxidoreductase [Atractiella rhizophila]|nr:FAD dependent oxidoreductase [Atractiella rhizophila]